MGGVYTRLLLQKKRQRHFCLLSRQLVRNLYTPIQSPKQLHDPSPSELLRFTLTGSTKPIQSSDADVELSGYLNGLFSTDWKSNSPPASLWTSLKGLTLRNEELLRGLDAETPNISFLRSLIERYVKDAHGSELLQAENSTLLRFALQRCQRQNTIQEIITVVSDLIARLNRLQLQVQPGTYATGISLAVLDLSPSALEQFVRNHQLVGLPVLGARESIRIVQQCSEALDCKTFEDPNYDPTPMLAAVTGEGEADLVPQNRPILHDILYWRKHIDQPDGRFSSHIRGQEYIYLLARLGSDEVLHKCWNDFLKNLQPKDHHSCLAAYQVVLTLIQNVRSEIAVKYLEDVSQRCGDTLPFISRFSNLQVFVDDPVVGEALPDLVRGEDYLELLEARLKDMGQRMGVQWDPQSQEHSTTAPEPSESIWEAFGDQLVPKNNKSGVNSSHGGQLYAELRVHGCSKSPAALTRIADLLHDHNGQSLQIVTHLDYRKERLQEFRSKFEGFELCWFPEHSPIELSDSRISVLHDSTKPSSPPSLGLLRARLIVGGAPQSGANTLHLMQLGCMDMRYSPDEPWQSSGYIVVWDRHFGELLGLYVGQNTGVIDSGPMPVGPLGALMHIRLSSNSEEQALSPSGTPTHPRNCWGPYHLDIDPSLDLDYD
ncbi:uncharacterized protein N7529_009905 [Penicillium soppii]|uniref:uncharacterized protein n=1 Tax=Penicillium soppii TaxID=69789 RepID=UPI002547B425|nr:uncharacterized protein N7529_009905 [Penicillium soppii]KAJ5855961.1 hypothetical protein N7529_009905 [Penicillium soppii]